MLIYVDSNKMEPPKFERIFSGCFVEIFVGGPPLGQWAPFWQHFVKRSSPRCPVTSGFAKYWAAARGPKPG